MLQNVMHSTKMLFPLSGLENQKNLTGGAVLAGCRQ
jgi:hypothetical protein